MTRRIPRELADRMGISDMSGAELAQAAARVLDYPTFRAAAVILRSYPKRAAVAASTFGPRVFRSKEEAAKHWLEIAKAVAASLPDDAPLCYPEKLALNQAIKAGAGRQPFRVRRDRVARETATEYFDPLAKRSR